MTNIWNKKHPQKCREYQRKYSNSLKGKLTRKKWEEKHPNYWEKTRYGRARENVFERDNWQCQVCGSSEPEELEVHHIDEKGQMVSVKEKNNQLENLITVCHRCHFRIHYRKDLTVALAK